MGRKGWTWSLSEGAKMVSYIMHSTDTLAN